VKGTIRTFLLAVLLFAFAPLAHGATLYVANTGTDGSGCGTSTTTQCRSISQAIALAVAGDTILVGPGRYGDLNRNGVLGDIAGEETGAPGCSCVLAINKNVIIISNAGAAVTIIDGRSVDVISNVLLITVGGEFGRPGKGFTVTETKYRDASGDFAAYGIALDVPVRGNQVVFTLFGANSSGTGIGTVNDAAIRIEGNQVTGYYVGIAGRGSATVSKNQVMNNFYGISATGGDVVGNVATANFTGIVLLEGTAHASTNAVYMNWDFGFGIQSPFSGVVTKNNIFANGSTNSNCGLVNDGVVGLNATNNYWGAASGPGAPPADKVCGSNATTSPFATKPFPVKPLKP